MHDTSSTIAQRVILPLTIRSSRSRAKNENLFIISLYIPYDSICFCPVQFHQVPVVLILPFDIFPILITILIDLDKVLESAVERRPEGLDVLPEVDGGDGALAYALGGEFEFLHTMLVTR